MCKPEDDPYFIPDEDMIAALEWWWSFLECWWSFQDETLVDDDSIPHNDPDDVPF